MTLGATHYRWRRDVQNVVDRIIARFPNVTCNTYVDHPWPGWDGQSIDVWGPGGRGDAINPDLGAEVRRYVFDLARRPQLRHVIYKHSLWTSFGGWSPWSPDDHSGRLRHVHFTFW